MLADVEKILALADVPYQSTPATCSRPPFPPYLFRGVLVNDLVVEVTRPFSGRA